MSPLSGIAIAAAPFLLLFALVRLRRRVRARRAAAVVRQIALTDAIHWELGAAAAPVVESGRGAAWVVRMAVPLGHAALVAALARITHELFRRLDGPDARVEIVLTDRGAPLLSAPSAADGPGAAHEPAAVRRLHAA